MPKMAKSLATGAPNKNPMGSELKLKHFYDICIQNDQNNLNSKWNTE